MSQRITQLQQQKLEDFQQRIQRYIKRNQAPQSTLQLQSTIDEPFFTDLFNNSLRCSHQGESYFSTCIKHYLTLRGRGLSSQFLRIFLACSAINCSSRSSKLVVIDVAIKIINFSLSLAQLLFAGQDGRPKTHQSGRRHFIFINNIHSATSNKCEFLYPRQFLGGPFCRLPIKYSAVPAAVSFFPNFDIVNLLLKHAQEQAADLGRLRALHQNTILFSSPQGIRVRLPQACHNKLLMAHNDDRTSSIHWGNLRFFHLLRPK